MDLVVLTEAPAIKVVATGRVIKCADAALVLEAAGLLAMARQREATTVAQCRVALEDSRALGLREGRAQAGAEFALRLAQAEAARHLTLHALAPTLVEIVADAVAAVLRSADRQQLIASALAAVDGLVKRARWARLRVHPSQAEFARAALAAPGTCALARQMTSVVADAGVGVDDCIFETDLGIADASLGVQIDALRAAIEGAVGELAAPRDAAMGAA